MSGRRWNGHAGSVRSQAKTSNWNSVVAVYTITPIMIIGLTGRNAAGKGEIAQYLKARGFEYFSLSDEIREEIRRRGEEISRESLINVGNELRARSGPGVLAERVLPRLERARNVVVDSIRNPFEVEILRRRKDFSLLAVEADHGVRFERGKSRGREGPARTLDQFLKEEERELASNDPTTQQLLATERLADIKISNNGTLEELQHKLDALL